MPKMLADHTGLARRSLGDNRGIVAAAPARRGAWPSGVSTIAGSAVLSSIEPVLGALAPGLLLVRQGIERVRNRNAPAAERAQSQTMMLVFDTGGIHIHSLAGFGRRLGPCLESHPIDGTSYGRASSRATETHLVIAGIAWSIHGWLERDLRAAIGPLGVELQALPTAVAD